MASHCRENALSERAARVEGLHALAQRPRRLHRPRVPWVYILRCSDNSLYVGLADDVEARVRTHNEGRGGSYTAHRRPVCLIYSEFFADRSAARDREGQLKHWSAAKKEALLSGNVQELKRLSKRRS
jgi:putative endonuclease